MRTVLVSLALVTLMSQFVYAQSSNNASSCESGERISWTTSATSVVDVASSEKIEYLAEVKKIIDLSDALDRIGHRSKYAFWAVDFRMKANPKRIAVLLSEGGAHTALEYALICNRQLKIQVVPNKHPILKGRDGIPGYQLYSIEEVAR